MPSYEIDADKLAPKIRKKLADMAVHLVFDPVGGRVLGRTDEKLPHALGIREIPDSAFDAAGGAGLEAAPSGPRALAGASRLEASKQWGVAPKSPRKAKLHWVAIGGDEQALGVELGDGRGDRVEIMRPVAAGLPLKGVSLSVQPVVDAAEELGVSIVLTSASERPWLEKGPVNAKARVWTTLTFDFSDVDEGKRSKVDQLLLVLHTQADEGLCLIKNLSLLG